MSLQCPALHYWEQGQNLTTDPQCHISQKTLTLSYLGQYFFFLGRFWFLCHALQKLCSFSIVIRGWFYKITGQIILNCILEILKGKEESKSNLRCLYQTYLLISLKILNVFPSLLLSTFLPLPSLSVSVSVRCGWGCTWGSVYRGLKDIGLLDMYIHIFQNLIDSIEIAL